MEAMAGWARFAIGTGVGAAGGGVAVIIASWDGASPL